MEYNNNTINGDHALFHTAKMITVMLLRAFVRMSTCCLVYNLYHLCSFRC